MATPSMRGSGDEGTDIVSWWEAKAPFCSYKELPYLWVNGLTLSPSEKKYTNIVFLIVNIIYVY
jgi:hypothetical protein